MYPLHLENQYERFFEKQFLSIARRVNSRVISRLKTSVREDNNARADSPLEDLISFIVSLREQYGSWIDGAKLEKQIARNFHLLDAWSRDKTAETLSAILSRLNTPQTPAVTGRPSPPGAAGELWLTTVDLLSKNTGMTGVMLDRIVKRNVGLINTLASEHVDGVANILTGGLTRGKTLKEMTDEIEHLTGVHRSKAKFWAADQSSKFFGEVTKERQTSAGIPGYVWRTLKDGRVRDNHAALKGRYFEWKNPPAAGLKGERLHPGEDYRCRCFAEPAFGPEYADKNPEPEDPLGYMRHTYPEKEVLYGEAVKPVIAPDPENRHGATKRYEELKAMSRQEVSSMVKKAQQAEWSEKSLVGHRRKKDRQHVFDDFGMSHENITKDILQHHSRVFSSYWHKSKRVGFYSNKYQAIIFVDESTNKVVSLFKPRQDFLKRLVEII